MRIKRRRRLIGVQRLPLARGDADHRAGHRRVDLGELQVRFLDAHAGLLLLHLRLQRVDLGGGGAHRGFGVLHLLGGRGFFGHQILLALQIALGFLEIDLALDQRRLLRAQRRAVGIDARGRLLGIDLRQQLAFFDFGADLDVQLLQLPRHLRADVDIVARLQRPGRADQVFDVSALHGGEDQFIGLLCAGAPRFPRPPAAGADDEREQ